MPTLTRPYDPDLWSDAFYPPMTAWRVLARIGGMLLVFVIWLILTGLICAGLVRLGLGLDTAALIGVPLPPLVVLALNSAGVFNRPRGERKTLGAFRTWIAGPAGTARGLVPDHLARIEPRGDSALTLEVAPDWLEQPADKRLADIAGWYAVWNFCRGERPDRERLALQIRDQIGREVGGFVSADGGSIWVIDQADDSA